VSGRRVKAFPPSLAGGCLRYAAMEILGFGRQLDAATRERMAAGAAWHRAFQHELIQGGAPVLAVEAPVRAPALGIAGRMDAVVQGPDGPVVVEYKTVGEDRFGDIIRRREPPVPFWAQLALYVAVTGYPEGRLVIDARTERRRRLVFRLTAPNAWGVWTLARVERARAFALAGRLPPREPATHCFTCDRWTRCFASEAERAAVVADHPDWEPDPPLETLSGVQPVEETS
jgi:hypothetical protein